MVSLQTDELTLQEQNRSGPRSNYSKVNESHKLELIGFRPAARPEEGRAPSGRMGALCCFVRGRARLPRVKMLIKYDDISRSSDCIRNKRGMNIDDINTATQSFVRLIKSILSRRRCGAVAFQVIICVRKTI